MTFKEHDIVYLLVDLPSEGLKRDDSGTVVHVYPQVDCYEVEFQSGVVLTISTSGWITKLKP